MKTVFVIGAGAGVDIDMPMGDGLRSDIRNVLAFGPDRGGWNLDGDELILPALRAIAAQQGLGYVQPALDRLLKAAELVCKNMLTAPSIDQFIDDHIGNRAIGTCGKLAIVRTILKREANSKVSLQNPKKHLNVEQLNNTWFMNLHQLLLKGPATNLANRLKSVAFINFNYDRCIEHYLYHAIQKYYGVDAEFAALVMGSIDFIHPYGTTGSLPWQRKEDPIDFGGHIDLQTLIGLATKIRTFTEAISKDNAEVARMRQLVGQCDRLVFLGFAYYDQNLELILAIGVQLDPRRQCSARVAELTWSEAIFGEEVSLTTRRSRARGNQGRTSNWRLCLREQRVPTATAPLERRCDRAAALARATRRDSRRL